MRFLENVSALDEVTAVNAKIKYAMPYIDNDVGFSGNLDDYAV